VEGYEHAESVDGWNTSLRLAPAEPTAPPAALTKANAEVVLHGTLALLLSDAVTDLAGAAARAERAVFDFNALAASVDGLWRAWPFVAPRLFGSGGGDDTGDEEGEDGAPPLSVEQRLLLLALCGLSRVHAREQRLFAPYGAEQARLASDALDALTPRFARQQLVRLARGGAAPAAEALRALMDGGALCASLAEVLSLLAHQNAGAASGPRPWLAAAPLLVAAAWTGVPPELRPRVPRAHQGGSGGASAAREFDAGVASAAEACAQDGAPWRAVEGLLCEFVAAAPGVGNLAALLARRWAAPAAPAAQPLAAAHVLPSAALCDALQRRYEQLLGPAVMAADVAALLRAAPCGGGGGGGGGGGDERGTGAAWAAAAPLSDAWASWLGRTWSVALLYALRAVVTQRPEHAARATLDARAVAHAAAALPMESSTRAHLLGAAAALALHAPELLPLLLAGGDGGAWVHGAPEACAAWLRAHAGGARASPSAVFDALRLFESHAGGAAVEALLPEVLTATSRMGLRGVLSAAKALRDAPGSAVGRAALHAAAAAARELRSVGEARDALLTALAAPEAEHQAAPSAALQVPTLLLAHALGAVLDRFSDGGVLLLHAVGARETWALAPPLQQEEGGGGRSTALPPLLDAMRHGGGAFWCLIVGACDEHAGALRAHRATVRVLAAAAAVGAAMRAQMLSAAALHAIAAHEARPALLLLMRAADAAAGGGDATDGALSAQLDAAEARVRELEAQAEALAWFLELCAPSCGAAGCDRERQALYAARAALPGCALASLGTPAFWGAALNAPLRAAAASLAPLRGSDVLAALWRTHVAGRRAASSLTDIVTSRAPLVRAAVRDLWGRAEQLSVAELDAIGPALPSVDAAVADAARVTAFMHADDDDDGGDGGDGAAAAAAATRARAATLAAQLCAYVRRRELSGLAAHFAHFCDAFDISAGARTMDTLGIAFAGLDAACARPGATLVSLGTAVARCEAATVGLEGTLPLLRAIGTPAGCELVRFMKAIAGDDLTLLIDAAEDRDDGSALRAADVNDAILVGRALGAALALPRGALPDDVLRALLPVAPMAARVANCAAHAEALKQLHASICNRGEMTRATVRAIIADGRFKLAAAGATPRCALKVQLRHPTREVDATQLHDLQQRALLLLHERDAAARPAIDDDDANVAAVLTPRQRKEEDEVATDMETFLGWMEAADAIVAAVTELRLLGCISFRAYDVTVRGGAELAAARAAATAQLAEWQTTLGAARTRSVFLTCFSGPQLWLLSDALLAREREATAPATALLRFVHPATSLGSLPSAVQGAARFAPPAWLAALAAAVEAALARVAHVPPALPAAAAAAGAVACPPDVVSVLSCAAERSVGALASLFAAACAAPPRRCQLLVCDADTSCEEVDNFVLRVTLAPGAPLLHALPFVVAHAERLSEAARLRLAEALQRLQRQRAASGWRLAVLCDGVAKEHALRDLQACCGSAEEVLRAGAGDALITLPPAGRCVTVVTSAHPGLGKTAYIAATSAPSAPPKSVLLAGDVRRDLLVGALLALVLVDGEALHVQLGDVHDVPGAHMLLYELTQLRCVPAPSGVAHLAGVSRFYIEVANPSVGGVDGVLARLPLLCAFERRECAFALQEVRIGASIAATPDVHVVCAYLELLETNTADTRGLHGFVPGDKLDFLRPGLQVAATPLPAARAQQLLAKHFLDGLRASTRTYATLDTFLRVLGAQLRRFTCSMSMTAFLEEPERRIRANVLLALVAMARDFATASSAAARDMQASNLRLSAAEEVEQNRRRMDSIVKWGSQDNTLIVVDSAGGSIISLRIAAAHRAIRTCMEQAFSFGGTAAERAAEVLNIADAT
jgi:hypothetical protein